MSLSFDVLLPTHNGEAWLHEAIESVLAQTWTDWRLVIVDDCSEDRSREIAREYAERRPDRIEAIALDRVHRAAGARMVAVARGSGDAIAFLDQDDRWLPLKLARQAQALASRPEAVAVHTNVEFIGRDGERLLGAADDENLARMKVDWHDPAATASALLANNRIRLVSSAVRRAAFEEVGGFDTSLFGGEDWHLWVRLAWKGRILHLPDVLLQRRVHGDNVTRVYSYPRALGRLDALDKLDRCLPLPPAEVARKRRKLLGKARDAAKSAGRPLRALRHSLELAWEGRGPGS